SRSGERTLAVADLIRDAFTTSLAADELVKEIVAPNPPASSGGAYLAYKRCAPVYASAGVAAQLTMRDKSVCSQARIVLGAVGLTPIAVQQAEAILNGKEIREKEIEQAAEAAGAAADPHADLRGSGDCNRRPVRALARPAW